MRRLLSFIAITIASLYLSSLLYKDSGYVLVKYSNVYVETPLWLCLIFLISLHLLINFGVKIINFFMQLRNNIKNYFFNRRHKDAVKKTKLGVEAYFLGDWQVAEKNLIKGAYYSEIKLLNYILAANAAQYSKAFLRRDKYLKLAYESLKSHRETIRLTEVRLDLEKGDLSSSLETLQSLLSKTSHPKQLLTLMKEVYLKMEDWDNLAELLDRFKEYNVLSQEEYFSFSKEVYQKILMSILKEADVNKLEIVWQKVPTKIKHNPEIVAVYAKILLLAGNNSEALEAISNSLRSSWCSKLAVTLSYLQIKDLKKQIMLLEQWLKKRVDDPDILLALGRLYSRSEDFTEAQKALERSLELKESLEVYNELACLMNKIGDKSAALEYFKRASELLALLHRLSHQQVFSLPDL